MHAETDLLWCKHHQLLFLWHPPSAPALLHKCLLHELVVFLMAGINIIVPSITIFVSYGLIFSNIFHISSMEGRSKALSTCSSHIIAVSLFFGSMSFVYLKPSAGCMDERSISSVFYTKVVAMRTPLFYSFRNKDVKTALRKTVSGIQFWLATVSLCR